jgi:hypothetical protein
MSVILTFVFWFIILVMYVGTFVDSARNIQENQLIFIIFGTFCIFGFLFASQLMVNDWLREKPRLFCVLKLITYFFLTLIFALGSALFTISLK